MYALINTMSNTDTTVGRIISMHRTEESAFLADAKLQRMTRRSCGQNSYIPTITIVAPAGKRAGDYVQRSEI